VLTLSTILVNGDCWVVGGASNAKALFNREFALLVL
jgi:hypothetical protein